MNTTIEARRSREEFIQIVLADPELLEGEFDAIVVGLAEPPTASRVPADPPVPRGRRTPGRWRAEAAVPADNRSHGPAARPPPRD